jgi:hypothetical protein
VAVQHVQLGVAKVQTKVKHAFRVAVQQINTNRMLDVSKLHADSGRVVVSLALVCPRNALASEIGNVVWLWLQTALISSYPASFTDNFECVGLLPPTRFMSV